MYRLLLVVMLASMCVAAMAADNNVATQTVNITVKEIALLNVSAAAPTFTVDMASATAGAAPVVTESVANTPTLKYTVVVNNAGTAKKITLGLGANVPAGLTLKATATPAAGAGTGQSDVVISTAAADLITGIPSVNTDAAGTAGVTLNLSVSSVPSLKATVVGTPFSTTATYTLTAVGG